MPGTHTHTHTHTYYIPTTASHKTGFASETSHPRVRCPPPRKALTTDFGAPRAVPATVISAPARSPVPRLPPSATAAPPTPRTRSHFVFLASFCAADGSAGGVGSHAPQHDSAIPSWPA
eukprot:5217429-Prymnesium_polylepis.2